MNERNCGNAPWDRESGNVLRNRGGGVDNRSLQVYAGCAVMSRLWVCGTKMWRRYGEVLWRTRMGGGDPRRDIRGERDVRSWLLYYQVGNLFATEMFINCAHAI